MDVGSNFGDKPGDYDFTLKESSALIYAFKDRPDILTNDMVWALVSQNASTWLYDSRSMSQTSGIPWADQNIGVGLLVPKAKVFTTDLAGGFSNSVYVTLSETENHIMMIYSWKYLINNYVRWVAGLPSSDPRYDSRIVAVFNDNPSRYTNGDALNDFVLKIIGRIMHRGAFETDAKAYSSLTFSALMNFYSYAAKLFPTDANCNKVRLSAQNSLDYLSANFAFQSLEGKRNAPMRRNWDYKTRVGPYANDYLLNIIGMLSGGYVFDDTNGESDLTPGYAPPSDVYKKPYHFSNLDIEVGGNYQQAGFALWAALGEYRIPRAIEDFLLNKYNGWYVKNQSNFYKGEYWFDYATNSMPRTDNTIPNYFGTGGSSTELHPVSQSFFVTRDFVNSGGGISDQYTNSRICGGPVCQTVDEINQWNVVSKPNMVITKGDVGFAGADGTDFAQLSGQMLMNYPGKNIYDGKVLGIFKSFTLCFDPSGLGLFRYPTTWNPYFLAHAGGGAVDYKVFDFRSAPTGLNGYYLILATLNTYSDAYGQSVKAGWWEIVPGNLYATPANLATFIQNNNLYWNNVLYHPKPGDTYQYTMASSNDKVTIKFDLSATKDLTIASIRNKNNDDISSLAFTNNNTPLTGITTVWQVDQNYNLTNFKYAESPIEGQVTIRNPHISAPDIILNSVDYKNPASSNPNRAPVKYRNQALPAILSLLQ